MEYYNLFRCYAREKSGYKSNVDRANADSEKLFAYQMLVDVRSLDALIIRVINYAFYVIMLQSNHFCIFHVLHYTM